MNLKSLSLAILFMAICWMKSFSQASLYTPYAFSTASPSTIPAGTTVAFTTPFDDDMRVITPGFNFQCGGRIYNNFLVSSNGWVALLPTAAIPAYFTGALPANSLSSYAGGTPLIAPMWDDIATNQFVWAISGSDLFIRWNAKMPKNSFAFGYTLGVRLSASGAIAFIYPTSVYNMNGAGANSASIGYASGCGEYYSITPTAANTATLSDAAEFSTALSQIVTTWTGTAGNPTINVGSSAGIVPGLFIGGGTGANIAAPGATVAGVAGTIVTSSANNTGTLSGNGYFYMRPNNIQYVLNPTMNANDFCANATSLGTITAACTYITSSNAHNTQTSASGPSCAVTDTGDVWFSFIKPAGVTAVTVTTAPVACPLAMTGTTVEVFASCAGAALGCATTSIANPTYVELSLSRPCAAETLLVRVTGDNNRYGKFQICAKIGSAVSNLGFTCSSAQAICSLPVSIPGNTAGAGNEYDSTNAVCHTISMNGEDFVYTYTPTANECVTITGTTAGPSIGISVYNGCPDSTGGAATYCLRTAESITGSATITSVTMTAGVTYYIVVDSQTGSVAYTLNMSSGAGTPANDICGSATNLGTIASGVNCSYTTYTTACATPSPVVPNPAGVPAPTCVPNQVPRAFIDGVTGDVWIRFAAGYTGTLQIATVQSAVNPTANAAMAVYTGASCAALTLVACDYNSGVNGMPLLSIPVSNGVTYYIRVWSENPEDAGQFDICFSSNCAPPNDAPCSAVNVPLGSTTSGYNTCAGITGEPLNAAQCVAGGTINTVWYSAVVPASGQIHVRTHPLTLTDTQIQGFTFASGCANAASTSVSRGCNDDGPNCSGGFQDFSDQNFTGLTPGDILYIAVDGTNSLTGSFEITFIDGTAPAFPPIPQQDCAGAQVVCSTSNITVADPGFRNYGNICDMATGANTCWGVGERNSVWYSFTTSGTGKVKFDILTPSSTNIDFILWDVTGVSNPCSLIQTSALANVGCNYASSLPATGLMDPPLAAGYSNAVNVTGTRTFILLLNVFNSAINAGFTLNWQGTPIAAAGTAAIWSGGTAAADTLFGCGTCWGDCGAAPTCGVDAIVNPVSNLRQPTVTVNSSVRDLIINAGATLRIKAGITLSVCGNFTNNGTLICEPGSTVQFQLGSAIQTISGNLTGANSFANLVINKTAGSVVLATNIDVSENFTTSTNTSQFNINGKYMKVGGNFTNANGTGTFLIANLGNSRVEFNGTANQNFTNTAGTFNFNRMIMNKPSGILFLMGANSSINIDTTLTLTSGVVNTRNVTANYIYLKWINANAVTGYNVNSYIDGKLRRQIYNFGYDARGMLLDWPVGDATKGYQLANILFALGGPTPGLSYLTGSFDSWNGSPPLGPFANDCNGANYNLNPLLNHGYWTFSRSNTANYNGRYTLTMKNTGFTNDVGTNYTIVSADMGSDPNISSSWSLVGQCIPSSTQYSTQRTNINGSGNYSVSTTAGSNILTTSSTASFYVGLNIYATGIPTGSVISSIITATSFSISNPATATGTVFSTLGLQSNSATFFNHLYAIGVGSVSNPLQASAVQLLPIICNGGQAKIEVTASGGSAPYQGIGEFFVNSGINTFTIFDSNGDSVTTTIVVNEPTVLSANSTATPILCNNLLSNITVTAVGGTPPYTGTGSYSEAAGTYSYIVTDLNNCTDTSEVLISQPPPLLSISVSATPIIVNGGVSNVTVSALGGTPPYSGTGIFNELAGNYTYTVTDSNGCSAQTTILISEPSQLMVTATQTTSILCYGGTANVLISASGGVAPYTGTGNFTTTAGLFNYSVTDSNGVIVSGSISISEPSEFIATANLSSPILCHGESGTVQISTVGGSSNYSATFSVQAGNHNYTIIDSNGCSSSASINVTEPDSLIASLYYLPINCFNGTTTVLISAQGGTPPYSGTGSFIVGAGTHNFLVTDINGCSVSQTVTINQPQQIQVSATAGTINCFGGNTTVEVTAQGGLAPYIGTGNFVVVAGTSNFSVTDANGCTSNASITLLSPSQIFPVATQTSNILCNGGSANVTVSASGGTSPYSGTGIFSAVAGTHIYNVTDANGCIAGTPITISQPNPFVATASLISPILCHGGLATISINTTGGSSNYSSTFNVPAGSHNYTIIDANGCTSSASITVTQPDSLKAITSFTPINCFGGTTTAIVNAIGGTSPYTGVGNFNENSGLHTFNISDANGCTAVSTISLGQPSQLIVSAIPGTINCNGGTTTVNVTASGGTTPYSGTGNFSAQAGNHTYTVTDANGCTESITIAITQSSNPVTINITQIAPILCYGQLATIQVSGTGGEGSYSGTGLFSVPAGTHTYTISDINGCSASNSIVVIEPDPIVLSTSSSTIQCYGGNVMINVSAAGGIAPYSGVGNFTVPAGLHTYNVSDVNNCTASTFVSVNQPTKVEGTTTSTSAGCIGNSGTLTVTATGGTGGYSYLWSNGQTTSIATGLVAGSYTVTITDANNCTGSVSATVASGGAFPVSPGAITGPTSLCRNMNGIVFSISPVAGATSYQWTLPNGISGSSTSTSITVSTSSTYAGGFICVAAVNNCGTGATSCINVPVIATYPSRPNILNGPSVTCGPGVFTYSTSANNASSFTWTVTGSGVTILSGQGTNTIQLSVPAGFSQGSVQVYSSNCYGNSSTRGTTLTGNPVHSNSVIGPTFVCANNSAVYTMPLVPGVTSSDYVWSVTGDAMVTSSSVGSLSSTATINFGPSWTTGVVTITVFNICGSHSRSFTVRSTPPQPGSISGPNTGLCNLSGVSYSIGAVTTATSYTWSVPPGVTIVSTSPNGQSIVVDFTPAFTSNSADICVTANSACGSSTSRCYTVTSRTVAPTISGPTSVCKTQSNVAYNVTPLSGVTSYTWTVSDNAIITPAGSTANVNFNTSTGSSVIVRASAINACGVSPIGLLGVGVNVLCRASQHPELKNDDLQFSPNPVNSKGVLSIQSLKEMRCIIQINDIFGKVLFQKDHKLEKGENNYELDFEKFSSGIYFVSVLTENGEVRTLKVIVNL